MKKFMTILTVLLMLFVMTACESVSTDECVKVKETVFPDGSKTERINRPDDSYDINDYDSDGNHIKFSHYTKEGILDFYYISEYDSKGNNIKESAHNADGTLKYYYTFEYDSDGNKIKGCEYASDGTLQYIFEYDSKGNHIKTSEYNPDETLTE